MSHVLCFFAWDVPWVFWLGTYHPPQAEQKICGMSHGPILNVGPLAPVAQEKRIFAGISGLDWGSGGQKAGVAGGYSAQHGCARVAGGIPCSTVVLGLRAVFRAARLRSLWAAIPRSTVVLRLRAVFRAARLRSGCGGYSAQHGCARVAGGIPRSTVALRLWRLFRAARLCSGCGWCSAQHGCAPVAGGLPCSTVALGLRAVFPCSTVALGLWAAIPRSTVCARVAGGIPRSTVALGLWAAIPRSTVVLRLRVVFRAARLRSGCGRSSAQHGCARVAGGIPCSTVALGLWAAIPRSTVVLRLRAAIPRSMVALGLRAAIPRSTVVLRLRVVFRAARCAPVAGGLPRSTVALRLRVRIEEAKYVLIYLFRKLSLQNHSMALQPHASSPLVKVPMLERRRDRSDLEAKPGQDLHAGLELPIDTSFIS
ncbi:hypothetical protein B0H14DRAFT_2569765 [Mycena olivaceomarginata]|nr:hypothetical protein B0H14DRAFT_2569765 [Mycena olivaceomarginata]